MLEMMFIIAIIIEIGLPIALAFFLKRKLKSSWVVVAVGSLAFVISQLIHIPILIGLQPAWLSEQYLSMPPIIQTLIYAITLGFLAGVCEESMRWLSFQLLREKGENVQTAVLLGVGHGGVESVVLVGFSVLSNFVVMVGLHNGWIPEMQGITNDMVVSFFNTPWHLPLAGAVERISALGLHIGLSLLVWQSIKNRSWIWFFGAIVVHALFDAIAVMTASFGLNTWLIELIIILMASVVVYWAVKFVKQEWALQLENEPTPEEIAAA